MESSRSFEGGGATNPKFMRFNSELAAIKRNIQDIKEMNENVRKNDKLQKKEVDHAKKLKRDKETQAIYLE